MKALIVAVLAGFAGSALADQAKVQLVVALSVCTLDAQGAIVECNASNNPPPIRETLTASLDSSDTVDLNKSYSIADPVSGESFPLEVAITFSRDTEILPPKTPYYLLYTRVNAAGAPLEDEREALASVKDLAAFRSLTLRSKRRRIPKPGGNVLELIPRVNVVGIEIVK